MNARRHRGLGQSLGAAVVVLHHTGAR